MKTSGRRPQSGVIRSAIALSMCALIACRSSATPPAEQLGQVSSAVWTNGSFESGSAGSPPSGWTVTPYLNPGVTISTPQTRAGLNLESGGSGLTTTLSSSGGPESQPDPSLGTGASLRWPKYGNQVAIVNQLGKNQNTNSLSQTMTIASGDVDPSDGNIHVRFVVAPVLENPGHPANQQPYYFVQLTNLTRSTILYNDYNASAQPGVPWKISNGYYYTDWQLVDISPSTAQLAIGDQVKLEVIAAGCSPGGHFGEVYVDGIGATVPGIFVSGTGPADANDGTNITYTLTYQNGGTTPVAGTTVTFNTPTNTTFQAVNAPGLTCTQPAVGGTGAVTCTVGTFAAGTSGSLQITVGINSGTTGTITAGNYYISGTAVSPLIGPKIYTNVTHGVAYADLGLTMSDGVNGVVWGQALTYTIVVGNPVGPNAAVGATVTDTFPSTLSNIAWTCVGSAGGTCAASGSGNINDSSVGLPVGATVTYTVTANVVSGMGSGQVANTASVAMPSSGSDPSLANNAAGVYNPIASANGVACTTNTDCSSGTCDMAGGICVPAGGCGADSDCTVATQWCNTESFTCVPRVANGVAIPTVSHHSPALTGTCSTAAAAAVCASDVCDTVDNACGYAPGDGQCTIATGPTVCRSGQCSVDGTCNVMNGCEVDGDCSPGNWCDESTHVCTAQIANGGALPTDSDHVTPIIDGLCNPAAAALVCQSGVCDSDNACGYGNGDGSCTSANAGVVCRSGACDADGKCGYVNGDGPCSGNGALCRSNVCSADGNCGYANGDGPCDSSDATTVCRSSVCASTGPLAGKCGQCASDSNCAGATPACDTTSATCVACTASNASACSGATPLCNVTTETCTACNGDDGTSASLACPTSDDPYCVTSGSSAGSCGVCSSNADCAGAHAGPICSLTTGACGNVCAVDTDCAGSQWCNSGACTPKVANGDLLPSADPIDATCTTQNGLRVCESGVCDADNRCGFANGDGSCNGSNGATVCRSAVCAAMGAHAGTCEPCNVDGDCSGATPACDSASNACVQCTSTNASACTGATPSCDVATEACVACAGDFASGIPDACSSAAAPFCTSTGSCGLCATNQDCMGSDHTGPICDAVTGSCGTACRQDSDCASASEWCNAAPSATGSCVPKLANGTHLPSSPSNVTTCSATVGARVCAAGVCDTNDDKCGLANGDGTCSSNADCRAGVCSSGVCGAPESPDAGTPDSGPSMDDAGAPDTGAPVTPANDAGAPLEDNGSIEGGGLACSTSFASHDSSGAGAGALFIALGVVVARRRRSR
jgi:uncharacterized repeat protein (TIGR01451 family)